MNLRNLKVFVATQMANQLAECGIDVDQIEQIKIQDRTLPPDDDVVWKLKTDNHSYSAVMQKIDQWINSQIVICYMNDTLNRDLSIEIMGNGKGMMAI